MRITSRITRRRLLIGLVLVIAAGITGAFVLRAVESWSDRSFEAADYPRLAALEGWWRYGFPAALPSDASNVVIYAPAAAPSILPAPDQYVEVCFVLPPAQAAALLDASRQNAPGSPAASEFSNLTSGLQTADDRASSTPLPAAFQHVLLRNPSGMNVGGVSINPDTGEVVYWIFEF